MLFRSSKVLRFVKKPIIVAFADPDASHLGIIYQASNFIYTGKSQRKGRVIAIRNNKIHNKTLWKEYKTAKRIKEVFGEENVYYKEYNTKHRYVFFNCHPKQKKKFESTLIYKIENSKLIIIEIVGDSNLVILVKYAKTIVKQQKLKGILFYIDDRKIYKYMNTKGYESSLVREILSDLQRTFGKETE